MTDEVGAFLAHHGVKGMHWGVRQSRNEVDRAKPKGDRDKPKITKNKMAKKVPDVLSKKAAIHPDDGFLGRLQKKKIVSLSKKASPNPEDRKGLNKAIADLGKTPMRKIILDMHTKERAGAKEELDFTDSNLKTLRRQYSKLSDEKKKTSTLQLEIQDQDEWREELRQQILQLDFDIALYGRGGD